MAKMHVSAIAADADVRPDLEHGGFDEMHVNVGSRARVPSSAPHVELRHWKLKLSPDASPGILILFRSGLNDLYISESRDHSTGLSSATHSSPATRFHRSRATPVSIMSLIPVLATCLTMAMAFAAPDVPFPVAASSFGPIQASLINNDVQSFLATETAASAFQAAVTAFAAVTDAGLVHNYRGDPNMLALEYFTATATPTWWTELPKPLQTYIQQVGGAEAAIASSDAALSVNETPATSTMPSPATSTTGKSNGCLAGTPDGLTLGMVMGLLGAAIA